jgi:hypothetical protein
MLEAAWPFACHCPAAMLGLSSMSGVGESPPRQGPGASSPR